MHLTPPKFGPELVHHRVPIPHLGVSGTQVAACITPREDRDATLQHAWQLMRALAQWLLAQIDSYPNDERFMLIFGWSREVSRHQGQIFKAGGTKKSVEEIASSDSFIAYERKSGSPVLLPTWEKDVVGKTA